jgi:hypothetical protein
LVNVRVLKLLPERVQEATVPLSEWKHLGVIADRIGYLSQQARAAAETGDLALPAHLLHQADRAKDDRQRLVDRLFDDVCATV